MFVKDRKERTELKYYLSRPTIDTISPSIVIVEEKVIKIYRSDTFELDRQITNPGLHPSIPFIFLDNNTILTNKRIMTLDGTIKFEFTEESHNDQLYNNYIIRHKEDKDNELTGDLEIWMGTTSPGEEYILKHTFPKVSEFVLKDNYLIFSNMVIGEGDQDKFTIYIYDLTTNTSVGEIQIPFQKGSYISKDGSRINLNVGYLFEVINGEVYVELGSAAYDNENYMYLHLDLINLTFTEYFQIEDAPLYIIPSSDDTKFYIASEDDRFTAVPSGKEYEVQQLGDNMISTDYKNGGEVLFAAGKSGKLKLWIYIIKEQTFVGIWDTKIKIEDDLLESDNFTIILPGIAKLEIDPYIYILNIRKRSILKITNDATVAPLPFRSEKDKRFINCYLQVELEGKIANPLIKIVAKFLQ